MSDRAKPCPACGKVGWVSRETLAKRVEELEAAMSADKSQIALELGIAEAENERLREALRELARCILRDEDDQYDSAIAGDTIHLARQALEASELPSGGDVGRKTSHNEANEQLEASDENTIT